VTIFGKVGVELAKGLMGEVRPRTGSLNERSNLSSSSNTKRLQLNNFQNKLNPND